MAETPWYIKYPTIALVSVSCSIPIPGTTNSSVGSLESKQTASQQSPYEKEEIDMIIRNPKLQSWWSRMKKEGLGIEIHYWPGQRPYRERDYDNFIYLEIIDPAGVNIRTEPFTEDDNNILGARPQTASIPTILTLAAYLQNGQTKEHWALNGLGRLVTDDSGSQYIDGEWSAYIHNQDSLMRAGRGKYPNNYVWTELNTAVRAPGG